MSKITALLLLVLLALTLPCGAAHAFLSCGSLINCVETQPWEPGFDFIGTVQASEIVAYTCVRTVTIPANFAAAGAAVSSQASCGTNPSETDLYTVKVAGGTIGTVSLTTGCVATFATTGGLAQSCTAAQRIEIDAPGTVSGADVAITLAGTR